MTTSAAFWDRIAPKYAKSPVRDMDAYEQTLKRTRAWLKSTDRVLELGCGTGTTALKLASAVAEITGTDISPAMINIAEDKARAEGAANTRFLAGTVETALRDVQGADAVLAFNLLHLVDDLPGSLRAIRGSLESGQHFISKTPCLGGRLGIRLLVAAMQALGKAPHVTFVRTDRLETMIREAGFEILETGDYPKSPPSHFIVARAI